MSAFVVTVTPTRRKTKKRTEMSEPTDVIMAPFSAKAIVVFEDVPVSKTARRTLRIVNPSEDDIEVTVSKEIRAEHNVALDWTENLVPAQSEIEMVMAWSPQMDVCCKETLQFTDSRNFRKDVMVILKSKNEKPAKSVRKFPTISSGGATHVKTLRLRSPTGSSNKTTKNGAHHNQQQRRLHNNDNPVSQRGTKPRWNSSTAGQLHKPLASRTSPLSERNAYRSEIGDGRRNNLSPQLAPGGGGVLKENVSPLTPCSVMNLIDNLKFTPATESRPKAVSHLGELALLPTPVGVNSNSQTVVFEVGEMVRNIRPRRLTTAELTGNERDAEDCLGGSTADVKRGDGLDETKDATVVVVNKTFDVKQPECLEESSDNLVGSASDGRTTGGVVLNKTTVIVTTPVTRTLEIIQEEDQITAPVDKGAGNGRRTATEEGSQTNEERQQQRQDLKRDVKLVGTPLRKYSESMKDLCLRSPQAKILTQGSLPNLNEMESIRSFEQNRYFNRKPCKDSVNVLVGNNCVRQAVAQTLPSPRNDSADGSDTSLAFQADLLFNQSEILAQSSRFNLNEVGLKCHKNTPIPPRAKGRAVAGSSSTPPKVSVKTYGTAGSAQVGNKRRSHELSFSDSPSTESIASSNSTAVSKAGMKSGVMHVSPPKRQRVEDSVSWQRSATPANASASIRSKTWSQIQPKKLKLAKTLSLVKRPITPRRKEEPPIRLYNSELYLQSYINPDPFAATTTCDPFLTSTMYLDECAVEKHQIDFKKWLNALVTIPAELDADCNTKIDVGKLFNEVRHKELMIAPTKEEQSMNYLTKFRLESLRRAAVQLFLSEEMRAPCSKIAVYVNKNAIRIRTDRNLHLDVVTQRDILELLLCFNPLWLRLGLEVVYGEKIHLQSNSDVVGLSTFILNRLFRDKFLEQKYSKAYTLSDEYADHIKRFTLQKMLFLLLFLDKAKERRIIKHNPCLFVKKSPHKETREVLLRFSSELLANVGDITRELRRLGYVLQHKQTFLDEFDYAFNNLAVDLRDGIRLTRVMEIILLRDDLSKQLRVPAISRLQRVFNLNLALRALSEADFELRGQITAADIADGHREKTLSLLWQIIYKFRSPKFHEAAKVLQNWWRRSWLRVFVRRRIRRKEELRREAAATKIQSVFRAYVTRKFVEVYRAERTRAAVVLQKHTRRLLAGRRFHLAVQAVVLIQRWYRAQLVGGRCRTEFLELRRSVVCLQRRWRRRVLARRLREEAATKKMQFEQKKVASAALIQRHWRALRTGRSVRGQFLQLRSAAIVVQRKFRAQQEMRRQRSAYRQLRQAAVCVQRRWRAKRSMVAERCRFLRMRSCVIKLQRRRRALLEMRVQQAAYVRQRCAVVRLQRRVRANRAMRTQRGLYRRIRESVCTIQRRYRALVAMRQQRGVYLETRRRVVLIQRKWRATLLARQTRVRFISLQYYAMVVQRKFRATKQMHLERQAYEQLRAVVVTVQRRFRAKREARFARQAFLDKLRATITLQRRYRAYKQMRYARAKFRGIRAAVVCLQQHVRGFLATRRIRGQFLRLRRAATTIQRAFRARLAMRRERDAFRRLRQAAVWVQRRYRAKQQMRCEMRSYARRRELIVSVQRRFRAKLLGRRVRSEFERQRRLIVQVQRRFRATQDMRRTRKQYLEERTQIICIQRAYRSYLLMKKERSEYLAQRAAAVRLQAWFRSLWQMRRERNAYQRVRGSALTIQRKWKATVAAREQRGRFRETVRKVVYLQRVVRATLQMRSDRALYQRQRWAATVLQRRFRARCIMLKIRNQYLLIRTLVVCVQRKFRAHRAMLTVRRDFLLLRATVVHLQQKFRGRRAVREQRERFLQLQRGTLQFQARARGYLARCRLRALMTPEMVEFLRRKKAAKVIQCFWRGYRVRCRFRNIRIREIRRNIAMLKETSDALNTVRFKIQDAVRILRGRFSASDALQVLTRLDRLSRTVPHLLMSGSDFISTFCYGIMAQAIRSEVDKQLIEHCSRIILNLARYNSTTANTFQEGGLVTIAQMLLRWCDKDCEIFNTLCTLIWVFGHCPHKREVIRKFMTTPEAIYMVRETKKLVARKEKMKQNVRKPSVASARSSQQNSFSSRALPSLEPDYGVIRSKPYVFISSVYAFDTILCKLGIDIFQ